MRLISCIILDDVEVLVSGQTSNKLFDSLYPNSLLTIPSFWQENAVVIHSIVGWKSSIGKWSRVQASKFVILFVLVYGIRKLTLGLLTTLSTGWRWLQCKTRDYYSRYIYTHITYRTFPLLKRLMFIIHLISKHCSSDFSGESVAVEDEVVVINSIVLPNKTLSVSVQEEIIL